MHALPRGRCVVLCKVGRHLRTIREISNGISALFPAGMGWVNDVNAGAMASAFPAVEQKLSRREGSHWLDAAEETFDLPSDFGGQFVTTSATPGSFSAWDAARIRLALRFLQLRWLVWLFIHWLGHRFLRRTQFEERWLGRMLVIPVSTAWV